MFPGITYKKQRKIKPEGVSRQFPLWFIAILITTGLLILLTFVFSVVSCRELIRLEEERIVLQKSRDSLDQEQLQFTTGNDRIPFLHMIIIPIQQSNSKSVVRNYFYQFCFHNDIRMESYTPRYIPADNKEGHTLDKDPIVRFLCYGRNGVKLLISMLSKVKELIDV